MIRGRCGATSGIALLRLNTVTVQGGCYAADCRQSIHAGSHSCTWCNRCENIRAHLLDVSERLRERVFIAVIHLYVVASRHRLPQTALSFCSAIYTNPQHGSTTRFPVILELRFGRIVERQTFCGLRWYESL